ncbi:MAG: outer membrane beta-barrel domain-containing protein [Pseudobdellovibrio sp.]
MISNLIKSILISALLIATVILFSISSNAAEINVPKDELAQESVYPIFDNMISVKSRNVKDSETFDIGIFGGLAITEPISNTSKFGVSLNYHFNQAHSLGLIYAKNSNGLSKDAEGLKSDFGLDFTRAPFPEYSLLADYNYKLFYGKLSVTKNGVINTSIYFSGSGGIIKYIHKSYPAIAIGMGERFYFTNNFALKIDLRFFINNAPIPFKTGALLPANPIPSYDSFEDRITYTTNLEVGLNYLF